MSEYTLSQKEYTLLKSRLTRAKNTKDPHKVIAECNRALRIFEQKGYPDSWSNWERARDDAKFAINYRMPYNG